MSILSNNSSTPLSPGSQVPSENVSLLKKIWKPVPLEAKYRLDPITKFRLYNRVPVKLMIHCSILALFVILVVVSIKQKNEHLDNATDALTQTFMPPDFASSGDYKFEYIFYNTSDIVQHIAYLTNRYYLLEFYSPGLFRVGTYPNGTVKSPIMSVRYRWPGRYTPASENFTEITEWIDEDFPLTLENATGPFTGPQYEVTQWPPNITAMALNRSESLWDKLSQLKISFVVNGVMFQERGDPPLDVEWEVSETYPFAERSGRIAMVFEFKYSLQTDKTYSIKAFREVWVAIHCLLAILSFWGLCLQIRAVYKFKRTIRSVKKGGPIPLVRMDGYGSASPTSTTGLDDETISAPTSNFSDTHANREREAALQALGYGKALSTGWITFTCFAYLALMCTSIEDVFRTLQKQVSQATMSRLMVQLGITAWCNCVVMCSYYQRSRRLSVPLVTVSHGLPTLMNFIFGIFPIFAGYALAGIILFGSYAHCFRSIDIATTTLFAVMNGDRMWDSFQEIYQTSSPVLQVISRFFFYSFVCLFIYACVNITLAIMSDAYEIIKQAAAEQQDKENLEKAQAQLKLDDDGTLPLDVN